MKPAEFEFLYNVGDRIQLSETENHSEYWCTKMNRLEGTVSKIISIFYDCYQLENGFFVTDQDIERRVD